MENQNYFLPSEIARLVLGYLKETECPVTARNFLKESKNLLEYSALLKRGIVYPTTIMGLTLIGMINDYGAFKLQEVNSNDFNSSFSSLWKQFDCVTKSLKEATKSKLRLPESQTSRTKRLNQRKKSTPEKKQCTKVNSFHTDVASDDEWVSDNERLEEEVGKTPEITSTNVSSLKVSRKTKSLKTKQGRSRNSAARNNKSKKVQSPVLQSQGDADEISTSMIEIDDGVIVRSPKSSSKTISRKQNGNCCGENTSGKLVNDRNDTSMNSINLVINEESSDNDSVMDYTWSGNCQVKKDLSGQSSDGNKMKNDGSKLCKTSIEKIDDSHLNQSEMIEEGMEEMCSDGHLSHHKSCEMNNNENNTTKLAIPLPPITPQKTLPLHDEQPRLCTPLKSFNQQQSSDHPYRSPRRKRQPPKRRPERGKSPDQSITMFPPPKADSDENTVSDYPDILDRLLKDTKLHEKLAENINKNILPRKQSLDVLSSEATVSKAVTVNTELSAHDKTSNPAASCSSNENANSMSDVIKGIADITESDPSFNSLFSLFMNAKESSVHEEVDQMMATHSHCLSQPTKSSQAQQHETLHTPTPEDQYVDVVNETQHNASISQSVHVAAQQISRQHSNELSHDRSTESNQNNNNMNNNNNSNSNQSQSSYHIGIKSKLNSQSIPNSDIINAVSSSSQPMNNSHYQPVSANEVYSGSQSQPAPSTNQPVPRTVNQAPAIITIDPSVNIQSPAPSVISIASPDVCFVPTPERTNTTKRPKRITPIPLNGNEVLSDVGKIASPQKPLVLVPAKSKNGHSNGFVICPSSLEYPESNSQNSQPVSTQNAIYIEPITDVQYVSNSYPNVSALSSSVCDIAVSPGGKNYTLHNKRSLKKAMEENHILSPITPINHNSQSSSSTPKDISIPVSHYAITLPVPEKSPEKKPSKPNILSHSSQSPPSSSKFPKDENSMELSSLKTLECSSVVHGSMDEQTFTAIPLGKLSRRMCHVRNLNFGHEALSIKKSTDEKPKLKTEMKRVVTLADLSFKSTIDDNNKTVMSLQNVEPGVRVRALKARNFTPISKQKSSVIAKTQSVVVPQTSVEPKKKPPKIAPKTPVKKTAKKKTTSKSRRKTKAELTKEVRSSATVSDPVSNATPEETTLSKFSPLVQKSGKRRVQPSRKKKKDTASTLVSSLSSTPPVSTVPLITITNTVPLITIANTAPPVSTASAVPLVCASVPALPVTIQAPADVVDILDSDTKEFNKQLKLASTLSNSESTVESVNHHSTASTDNLTGNSTPSQLSEDETKAAAEVLASLSVMNHNQETTSDKVKKGAKRKAEEEKPDAISSSTLQEKKKKKKSFDLKSVNIDALLAKVKYQ